MIADGRNFQIAKWEGTDYTLVDAKTGAEAKYPVVVILDRVARGVFAVK